MIRRAIGTPATGMAGLARTSVSGRKRVPRPAVKTSACLGVSRLGGGVKQHVGGGEAARAPVLAEETAIRIQQVVLRPAPERFGHLVDAAIAALELDERADGGFVHGHDHVLERELFAVLLVAEPDAETKMLEDAEE